MEEYQFSQGKVLRCGYTTGSCATAASKAAATMLLTGERVETVRIDTPKGIVLDLEPLDVEMTPDYVSCAIRKDSGDDPDDTTVYWFMPKPKGLTAVVLSWKAA